MTEKRDDAREAWIGKLDETPLGPVWIASTEDGVVAVSLWDDLARFERQVVKLTGSLPSLSPGRIGQIAGQLQAYFAGERKVFDLAINWSVMTPFQERALRAVCAIPYGHLSTYRQIAEQIGKPTAVRAVGRANATNPIPIIIPCHRVLGSDGKLHGYGAPGGLETKAWLLRLEGSWLL